MDPVSRLRNTVEIASTRWADSDRLPVDGGLTWGDLRAILLRLEVAETFYVPWCWEHACESAVCLPRHVIDDGSPLPAPFN